MQTGRSVDQPSPVIFDGQGRLYFHNVVIDSQGVYDPAGNQLYRVKRADFELISELGSGQYGTVWQVRHLPTGMMMAIKVVALAVSESALKQILTELDILMRSSSPFIVQCFGAFCSEASVYFCMELEEEGSVEKLVTKKPLGTWMESVLQAVAFSVVSGLSFLREHFSVIHRDIKPSNILIGRDGSIKICDFGVSGYLAQSLARTRVGTSNYMAPERISLGGNEIGSGYGVKADIWSLGATLMELSIGSPPFPLEKYDCIFAQLMDIIYSDPPKMPKDRGFSVDMIDFIESCLLKDPKERPSYKDLMKHPFIKDMTLEKTREIILTWLHPGND